MKITDTTGFGISLLLLPWIPLAVAAECKLSQRGVEYSGTLSTTISGRTCQRWDVQTPHAHNVDDAHFSNGDLAHNNCRNPSNDPGGPWCLTTDPAIRWQYCRVLFCSSCDRGCREDKGGNFYKGLLSYIPDGVICQRWDVQDPHLHLGYSKFKNWKLLGDIGDNDNYCRNPLPWAADGPWCYTMDDNIRYAYCTHVPYCPPYVTRVQSNANLDLILLLKEEMCQKSGLISADLTMDFDLSHPTNSLLFEVNYKTDMSQHDCTYGDAIQAYIHARTVNFSCGKSRTKYSEVCVRTATHSQNDMHGCRFKCETISPLTFSSVHVVIRPTFTSLDVCGLHSCPEY